jgi:hypothetical protein
MTSVGGEKRHSDWDANGIKVHTALPLRTTRTFSGLAFTVLSGRCSCLPVVLEFLLHSGPLSSSHRLPIPRARCDGGKIGDKLDTRSNMYKRPSAYCSDPTFLAHHQHEGSNIKGRLRILADVREVMDARGRIPKKAWLAFSIYLAGSSPHPWMTATRQ